MRLNPGRAFDVTLRTTPYIARRAMMYGCILAGALAHIMLLGLVSRSFGHGAFWTLFVISGGVVGWLYWKMPLFSYGLLNELHVGHLSLLNNLIVEDGGPTAGAQIPWAVGQLRERFRDGLEIAEVGAFIKKAVLEANSGRFGGGTLPPQPAMRAVCDAIMAYVLQNDQENVWEAARRGVALYTKSSRVFVSPGTLLEGVKLGIMFLSPLAFMVPLGIVALLAPPEWFLFRFGLCYIAVMLGWGLKAVVLDPLAAATMIILYNQETDGQEIDADTVAWLERESPAYRELAARAKAGAV